MTTARTGSPEACSSETFDLLGIDALLSDRELEVREEIRSFVEKEIKPGISEWWEEGHFPKEIVPKMGERGVFGMHLEGHGCPGGRAPSSTASLAWSSKPETRA